MPHGAVDRRAPVVGDAVVPHELHPRVAGALEVLEPEVVLAPGVEPHVRQVRAVRLLLPVVDQQPAVEVQAIAVVALDAEPRRSPVAGATSVPVHRTEYQSNGMPRAGRVRASSRSRRSRSVASARGVRLRARLLSKYSPRGPACAGRSATRHESRSAGTGTYSTVDRARARARSARRRRAERRADAVEDRDRRGVRAPL